MQVWRALKRLSVVIPNHNYGDFLHEAVESALALDWPEVEVIVVDDGSTDHSLEVLGHFAERISVLTQENSGPRVACNRGFAASQGDVVVFLDSDDVLEPSLMQEVSRVWRPGISKVQVQMRRIDRHGNVHGRVFPLLRDTPTPEQIRYWMTETSAYPTPPGSGNVYARNFLEQLFPLDDRCGDATDSACLAAAPYLGDVVTVPKPLVRYRVHGNNRSSLLVDPRRFTHQIQRAHQRHRFACELSGQPVDVDDARLIGPLRRGRHLLQMRVAEYRLCRGRRPIPEDGPGQMLRDAIEDLLAPGPESVLHRLGVMSWCLATLTAPPSLARRLIARRFA